MDEFDTFIDAALRSDNTPQTLTDAGRIIFPDVNLCECVVIDQKSYNPLFLHKVINEGCATLSFEHGKGLRITNSNGWVTIQILDAGCGKKIRHQTVPNSTRKNRQDKTQRLEVGGQSGIHQAWG